MIFVQACNRCMEIGSRLHVASESARRKEAHGDVGRVFYQVSASLGEYSWKKIWRGNFDDENTQVEIESERRNS